MRLRSMRVGVVLVLVALAVGGCSADISCSWGSGSTGETRTTRKAPSTSQPSTTSKPTTTSTTPTTSTTSTTSTTTTTLSPRETYRAQMRDWRDEHADDLAAGYAVISKMGLPIAASEEEIQAAKELDRSLALMVEDLEAIEPPSELSSAHNEYLASLKRVSAGVHDLATALEARNPLRATTAMVTIATAWEEGTPARTTLEQALGFSLGSAG